MSQPITTLRSGGLSVRFLAAAVLSASLLSSEALAQQPGGSIPLAPGTRVRVTATNLVAPIIGSFLQQRGDTAVFIEEGSGRGVWSLTLAQITMLEQSAGDRKSNKPYLIKGALYGAPAGLVASILVLKAFSPDSGKEWDRVPTYATGVIGGALIGAAIGSRYAREHWSAVALPRRVSFLPSRRGLNISLGFAF
jgi:hypothetical protein